MRTRRALLIASLLVVQPSLARADVFVTPFAGLKFGGSTSIVDLELAAGKRKLALGVGARMVGDGVLGFEVELGTMSGFFENDEAPLPLVQKGSSVTDLTGSFIFTLPPSFTRGGLQPYLVAGGGIVHAASEDFFQVLKVRRTVPAINLGAGATGLFTNNVGVRFDFRHLRSLAKDASVGLVGRRISYSRFTIGLLLRL